MYSKFSSRTLSRVLLAPLATVVFCAVPAAAQTFYGSVVGTVTDSSGAKVPNAAVTLTNLGTNVKQTATADGSGDYRFLNLVPGNYRVDVETAGFKHFARALVEVQVNTATRVDAPMTMGSVSETVEVTTAPPLLQTESGSLGAEVDAKTVAETPLNGRNTLNLLALVPGVVPQGNTSGSAALNNGSSTSSAAWGNYQIGGGMPLQSSMYIDGAPLNIMNKNFTAMVPVQDSIQEFKVETSAASPEFGRFGGGVVNMTTKSGSNAFHGTVYEYFRNNILNANSFFGKRSGSARPQYNLNQYGGAIGGPIWKDKAFFFYSYEQISIRTGSLARTNVPTAALRAGVFTARITDPTGICDVQPYTGQSINGQTYAAGGFYLRNLYAAGLKPGTTCGDPTGRVMASFYPLPNSSADPGFNYVTTVSQGTDGHQMTGRVDYALGNKQRIFGRFTFWPLADKAPRTLPLVSSFDTTTSQAHNHSNQLAVGDTISFTPTTLVDIRLDYLRQYGDAIPPGQGNVDLSQFGPAYAALAPFMSYKNLPLATFNTGTQLHNLFTFGYNNLTWTFYNNYHLSGGVTKVLGKHTLKAGAELRLIQRDDLGNNQNAAGTFRFSSGVVTGGDEWANLLMGHFDSGLITAVKGVTSFNWYKGFYVGDVWQPSQKLTLNLGLRWELPGAIAENRDNLTVLLPDTVDPYTNVKGTVGLVNSNLYQDRHSILPKNNLFGPRVGFAYRITPTTVFRGGYSLSYLSPDLQIGAYANASIINSATTTNTNSGSTINYTLANPFPATTQFPNGFAPAPGRSNPAFMTSQIGQAVTGTYPYAPYPASQQMNVSVGKQIGSSLLFDLGLAHTLGTHLPSIAQGLDQISDANIAQYGYHLGDAATTPIIYNGVRLAAAYQTLGQTLRPYPAYTNYSNNAAFRATSSYNALEAKLQKRFGAAGQIGAAYTWMKMIGDADTILVSQEGKSGGVAGSGQGAYQNYNNPKGERSIYSYNVPHRIVINYVLNLPFGKGQHFANDAHGITGAVISGWSASGITTFQSGYPVYLYTSGNALSRLLGAGTIRPNYAQGCQKTLDGSQFDRLSKWFNTSCFTAPTSQGASGTLTPTNSYAFGNEPRVDGAVHSSGIKNFDFSVVKSTPIREAMALQLRVEFFNIFNRTQFGPPVTQVDNTLFGQVSTQANNPRQIQAALRLNF